MFVNLSAFCDGGGSVLMGTVTAPGKQRLPWDPSACSGLGDHECSGLLGCRVRPDAADNWNRTAPDRWRRLHRRAYEATVAECGRGSVRLLARVWELQARGVLHVHPVVPYGTARQMEAARFYLRSLSELAPQYGFGWVDSRPGKVKPKAPREAAAYLSAYFVKGRGKKAKLWESVTSGAMPKSIIHVSTTLTQRTHCTMRLLRLRRAVHVVWRADLEPAELAAVGRLLEAFRGNIELVPVADPPRGPPA
jgi:hypothetical protein